MDDLNADEDTVDPDERRPMRLLDSRVQRDDELSDSDDEGPSNIGWRRNHARHHDADGGNLSPGLTRRVGVGIMGGAGVGGSGAGPSAHAMSVTPGGVVEEKASRTEEDRDKMEVDGRIEEIDAANGNSSSKGKEASAEVPETSAPAPSNEPVGASVLTASTLDDEMTVEPATEQGGTSGESPPPP